MGKGARVYTYAEMLGSADSSIHTVEKLNDEPHSTAKAYRVPGWHGTFAVISTVTEPFYGNCDRLRLTAEGKMRNCLFTRGKRPTCFQRFGAVRISPT